MNKKKNFLVVFSFLVVLVGAVVFSGCETSRVAPETLTPAPPIPPAQPLLLAGSVLDSKTRGGVSGATVDIFKLDGSKISSVVSSGDGSFSYNISSLTESKLKIVATAKDYGSSFTFINIDLVNKVSENANITIDKIVSVSVSVGASGGNANTPSTESKSTSPVSVNVPAGALATPTTLTLSQVPVNNVPPPPSPTTSTQVGVANLQPAGISFAQPVTLTFPLPYQFKTGEKIPLMEFNSTTGTWVTTAVQATVDNTGYLAAVTITKTGQYALLDNTKIGGTASFLIVNNNGENQTVLRKVTETKTFDFTAGPYMAVAISVPNYWVISRTFTPKTTPPLDGPSGDWITNNVRQRFGTDPNIAQILHNPGTYANMFYESTPWPGASPKATNANSNSDFKGIFGSWSVRLTYDSIQETVANITFDNDKWTLTLGVVRNTWKLVKKEHIWTPHNQGGASSYPY